MASLRFYVLCGPRGQAMACSAEQARKINDGYPMILDNRNQQLKVHEWITEHTRSGSLSIVTGYFSIGALAFFSRLRQQKVTEYRFVLGELDQKGIGTEHTLDLLNENITLEGALELNRLAREAVAFLQLDQVKTKTLDPDFCQAKAILFESRQNEKSYYITGSSNLTEKGMGLRYSRSVELNLGEMGDSPHRSELMNWFENIWSSPQASEFKVITTSDGKSQRLPFKKYLIAEISRIFHQYSPSDIYFKTLFELFGEEMRWEQDQPETTRQLGRLESTAVFQALYDFQKQGVWSLIKMLQSFNGAILADAVGLGKTWSALAVMKFYQLQGREVILLCPKKLQHNWRVYLKHQNSRFESDEFDYFIRFHTDLSEEQLTKYTDRHDQLFANSKPKLFVIDESHNLRNDKSKRYQFLLDAVIGPNSDVKILMLSATPINNSLNDIRNQFRLIARGKSDGFFDSLDIRNLDFVFRKAHEAFNKWSTGNQPRIADFIQLLPPAFFRLTDSLVLARTRSMIHSPQANLGFPAKTAPENIFVTPRQIGHFQQFEEMLECFPPTLSAYQPSWYISDSGKSDVLHDEKQRDRFLVKMIYILLVKRLESSWSSFFATVKNLLAHHELALDRVHQFRKHRQGEWEENSEGLGADDEEWQLALENLSIGKKRPVRMSEMDAHGMLDQFEKDLKADIRSLKKLEVNLKKFQQELDREPGSAKPRKSADEKLELLMTRIRSKQTKPFNAGNRKVIIFTVYKDTALYLFHQLRARGFEKLAVVTGDLSIDGENGKEVKNFELLLERFAPYTKLFRARQWAFVSSAAKGDPQGQFEEWKKWIAVNDNRTHQKLEAPIDILIATDVLSEGQNLQDGDLIINYDIHWNPVRVIQRMGRIDRLGSLNPRIAGINFWPSDNINNYLNLQYRIEQRMTAMKIAGSEVQLDFSDSFREMANDEALELRQKNRMLEQLSDSWEDADSEKSLGFDDFSLETFRQDLFDELRNRSEYYRTMPKAVYSGFRLLKTVDAKEGLIALLGYPASAASGATFGNRYRERHLVYIDYEGRPVLENQKDILHLLAFHKDRVRQVPPGTDSGDAAVIEKMRVALQNWLKSNTATVVDTGDGPAPQMGKVTLDLIDKIRTGSRKVAAQVKAEGPVENKFQPDQFDLISWFIVS